MPYQVEQADGIVCLYVEPPVAGQICVGRVKKRCTNIPP